MKPPPELAEEAISSGEFAALHDWCEENGGLLIVFLDGPLDGCFLCREIAVRPPRRWQVPRNHQSYVLEQWEYEGARWAFYLWEAKEARDYRHRIASVTGEDV